MRLTLMRVNIYIAIKGNLFQGYPKIIYYSSLVLLNQVS